MLLKHRFISVALQTLALTRVDQWLRFVGQGRGLILMFHHVRPWRARDFAPNRLLEITPEFLDVVLTELRDEGFEIIPLDALPDHLNLKRGASPFAALTFDDGY